MRVDFLCFIPMHIGYTACTIREQFGNRYAITVWSFWNKIDVIDSIFPLFPYLLIYRTEEVEGSNPSRSTLIPPIAGVFCFTLPTYGGKGLVLGIKTKIVVNVDLKS
jgi:hypothetical protein